MGLNSRAVETPPTLANAHMRLFGGAQFHRAMEEFRLAVGEIQVWVTSGYRSCGGPNGFRSDRPWQIIQQCCRQGSNF